jgi:type IV secretory pathway VirB10-like protein
MIQSAQVFSPRPSADPRENLRVLQSPLKVPTTPSRSIFSGVGSGSSTPSKAPRRSVSPLKFEFAADTGAREDEKDEQPEEEPEDQEVILVHTNHPRVVEEDKDLVILEDVPLPLVVGSSSFSNVSPVKGTFSAPAQPQPQQTQRAPPVTPRRKSLGGTALHRAVLIRSAQRAVWKAERERMEEEEEREEEMEVLDSVVDEKDSDEDDEDDEDEDEDVEMRSVSDDDSDDGEKEEKQPKPLWRKSLEKIIPWRYNSKEVEVEFTFFVHLEYTLI